MEQVQADHPRNPVCHCAQLLFELAVVVGCGNGFRGNGRGTLSVALRGFPFDRTTDIFLLFVAGVGISLFMGAIFFPLFYIGGEERNEVSLVISLLGGVGLVLGLTALVNAPFPAPMTQAQILFGGAMIIGCALAAFGISCPVATCIYRRKEY